MKENEQANILRKKEEIQNTKSTGATTAAAAAAAVYKAHSMHEFEKCTQTRQFSKRLPKQSSYTQYIQTHVRVRTHIPENVYRFALIVKNMSSNTSATQDRWTRSQRHRSYFPIQCETLYHIANERASKSASQWAREWDSTEAFIISYVLEMFLS